MNVPQELHNFIREHALEDAPRECCGLVAGRAGRPVSWWRCSNVALRATQEYEVDPDDQLYLMRKMAAQGLELWAIYHSHPVSRATVSLRDMEAPYPDTLLLIAGMARGYELAAWQVERIGQGHTVSQVPLEVV